MFYDNKVGKFSVIFMTLLLTVSLGSALEDDWAVFGNTIQDDWTEEERNQNPITIEPNLNEGEEIDSVSVSEELDLLSSLEEDNTVVELTSEIPENRLAGEYQMTFNMTTTDDRSVEDADFTVTVEERENISFEFEQATNSTALENSGTLGWVTVHNQGNTEEVVDYEFDTDLVPVNQETVDTVEDGVVQTEAVENRILFDIPRDHETGEYVFNLTAESQNLDYSEEIQLEIEDDLPPQIHNLEVDDANATQVVQIDTNVTDPSGVEEVRGEIWIEEEVEAEDGNETTTEIEETTLDTFTFDEIEEDQYTYDFEDTTNIGRHYLEIEAEDINGNQVSESTSFNIDELVAIRSDHNYLGSVAQTGSVSQSDIFEITYESDITVTLEEFDYDRTVSQSSIDIITPSGTSRSFEEIGDSITISDIGQYLIEVEGDRSDDYQITLSVEGVEGHAPIDDIIVEGDFVSVNVPDDTEMDWAGADHISCEVTDLDRSNIEDARYTCTIPFKITDVGNVDEEVMPMPPSVYNEQVSGLEQELEDVQSDLRWEQVKHWIKNFGFAFMFVFFIMSTTVYPRMIFFIR